MTAIVRRRRGGGAGSRLLIGASLAFLLATSLGLVVGVPEASAGRATAGSLTGGYGAYSGEDNRVRMVIDRRSDSDIRIEVRDEGVRTIDAVDPDGPGRYGCQRDADPQLARCVGYGYRFDYFVALGDRDDVLDLSPDRGVGGGPADAGTCSVSLGPGQDRVRLFDVRGLCSPLRIEAQDGQADTIDCGGTRLGEDSPQGRIGALIVKHDAEDRLENCPARASRTPAAAPAPRRDIQPPRVSLSGPRTQGRGTVLRRGLGVGCATSEPATCLVWATVSRRDARSIGFRVSPRGPRITVGGARTYVPWSRGGRRPVLIRLSAGTRRALARHRRSRPRMLVTATARDRAGNVRATQIWVSLGR